MNGVGFEILARTPVPQLHLLLIWGNSVILIFPLFLKGGVYPERKDFSPNGSVFFSELTKGRKFFSSICTRFPFTYGAFSCLSINLKFRITTRVI